MGAAVDAADQLRGCGRPHNSRRPTCFALRTSASPCRLRSFSARLSAGAGNGSGSCP